MRSGLLRLSALAILAAVASGEAAAQNTAATTGAQAPFAARPRTSGSNVAPSDAEIAAQRRSAELQLKRREDAAKRTLGSICNGC